VWSPEGLATVAFAAAIIWLAPATQRLFEKVWTAQDPRAPRDVPQTLEGRLERRIRFSLSPAWALSSRRCWSHPSCTWMDRRASSTTSSEMAARFLAWVVGWSVLLWAVLWGATLALDPAGVRAERRERTCAPLAMWKVPAYERSGARSAMLGNSRVALGMEAGPGFNLGLPAADATVVTRLAAT
jgi:hypothetical protein